MKEFVLMFRMDITSKDAQPSPEQMKLYMTQWMEWINDISDKGQLGDGGNHFSRNGKVLKPKQEELDGPYTKDNESVAGYIIIFAKNIKDAEKIAKRCPILNGDGTSVEIREIAKPGE
ncbi:MAG: YciI family protein [Bacteroidota bacterium]|nr:YciI family protein [Bacteroidota bacterium]